MSKLSLRYRKYLDRDYPLVFKELATLGRYPLPVPVRIGSAKPYTMMTIGLANELGLATNKRIACASFVELTGRIVTVIDDILDFSYDGLMEHNRDRPSSYELALVPSLAMSCFFALRDQVERNILSYDIAEKMTRAYCSFARSMFEGIRWQDQHGYFDDELSPASFCDMKTIMEQYVDRISGDLFAWAIDALRYYEHSVDQKVTSLVPAAYPFGRIFQINDDIFDLLEDLHRRQTTVVLSAIAHGEDGHERERLFYLRRSSNRRKLDFKAFVRLFPKSSANIAKLKDREYHRLQMELVRAGFRLSHEELKEIVEGYQNLRQRVQRATHAIS